MPPSTSTTATSVPPSASTTATSVPPSTSTTANSMPPSTSTTATINSTTISSTETATEMLSETRAHSLTRPCPSATYNWLMHPAPISAQDGLDPLQLAPVVFADVHISACIATCTVWR